MHLMMKSLLASLTLFLIPALVAASSPAVGNVMPRGGQRGTEMEITFNGARLTDALEVLLYSSGISVAKLTVVNDNSVKAAIKIAPDCRLGEHALRLRCNSGISELVT